MARSAATVLSVLAFSALAGHAAAGTVLFSDTFESTSRKPQWSSNTTINLEAENKLSWFSGRYSGNTAVTLTLKAAAAPPPGLTDSSNGGGSGGGGSAKHNLYTVMFDFYCIDSWDGNDPAHGPDRFSVQANTTTIFSETFGNVYGPQTMRRPDIGPVSMVFNTAYPDSVYRQVTAQFQVPDSANFTLKFGAAGLTGLNDESWGIDNVVVSYEVVPAPGSLALLGAGAMLLRRRRR